MGDIPAQIGSNSADTGAKLVQSFDTGDTVRHIPSGQQWLVAFVEDGRLCACGWPCSLDPVSDFELIRKATAEKRERLLQEMAATRGDDPRRSYARWRLGLAS